MQVFLLRERDTRAWAEEKEGWSAEDGPPYSAENEDETFWEGGGGGCERGFGEEG